MTKKEREKTINLINEIISSIENEDIPLSKALIKAKRIYRKTKDKGLEKFIHQEIEGDFDSENFPEYRIKPSEPIGIFQNQWNGRIQKGPLQYKPLLKEFNLDPKTIYTKELGFSIPEIEEWFKQTELKELMIAFSPAQLSFAKDHLKLDEENGWFLKSAHFTLSFSTFTQILATTQNRFIELLLKIENELTRSTQLDNEHFFEEGSHFDALLKITESIEKATKEIVLIDSYIDEKTLQFFSNKKQNVSIKILTDPKSNNARLKLFVESFNSQYQNLEVKTSKNFHDRFMIIDKKTFYHFGASIKDAGKKAFMFTKIEEEIMQESLIKKFSEEWNK